MQAWLGSPAAARWRAVRPLGVLSWTLVVAGPLALPALSAEPRLSRTVFVALVGLFFAVQLIRLIRAFVTDPTRRRPIGLLLAAVGLWGVGSVEVTARAVAHSELIPSLQETLFLGAYIAIGGYLVFDSGVRVRNSMAAWLDIVVITGGTACLASAVLLFPVESNYQRDGGAVLLALLYPLFDVMLALLVLAQVLLHTRPNVARALPLSAAFLLFAYADTHFLNDVATGVASFSPTHGATWAAGLTLLVGSASRRRAVAPLVKVAGTPRYGGWLIVLATAMAIAVLTLRPAGHLGIYLAVPAAITLCGSGARLMLALVDAQRAVEALAKSHTDDLTRLPNRRALRASLHAALDRGSRVGLMVLDLDGFKDINDTLGHNAGDHVLERLGVRIKNAVPPQALVVRLGGDEFGVFVAGADPMTMSDTAQHVLSALSLPMHVDGIDVALNASVGIVASSDGESSDSNELIRRAEVAMYRAKHARSGIAHYDAFHDDFSKAKLRISEELRRGIRNGELEVWYQPQIDASTLRPCALEALVRWRHPTDGLLAPVAFLPAARRAGLMPLLSQEVVRLAVQDMARWHAAGLRLRVAINCAPPELLSGVFVPRLHDAMRAANVPANGVVLEVTEESFIAEPERAREILEDVRDHGIQISIDDYGTGFSSLAYLRDLPVDELKLDRSFVSPIGTDARSRMIVSSTVQMARALGMRTVAEGVEDAATAADLIAMGVDALQGYHISRPIPASDVVDWIVQWPSFADVRLTANNGVPPRTPTSPQPPRVEER